MLKEKRIEWIDICKLIGIFFVILGHVSITNGVDIWIHAFHMPLFFLLSGLCFNEKKHTEFKRFLFIRFKTLIIPFLIFSIMLYLFWNGILYFFVNGSIGTCSNLLNCLLNPASVTSCYGAVNWFLPSLFFVEIIFWAISKLAHYSRNKCMLIIIILSIMAYFYPQITTYRLPFAIDSSIMGLFFYGFGWIIKKVDYNKIKKIISIKLIWSYVLLIFLFIVSYKLSIFNNMSNMRTLLYGDYFIYIFNAVGISLLFIWLSIVLEISSKKIKIINLFKRYGQHTLIILLLNSVIARLYNMIVTSKGIVINNKYLLIINNIFISLFIIIICVFISRFINKYLPFLLGKNFTKKSKK